jgi:hypothetical protein
MVAVAVSDLRPTGANRKFHSAESRRQVLLKAAAERAINASIQRRHISAFAPIGLNDEASHGWSKKARSRRALRSHSSQAALAGRKGRARQPHWVAAQAVKRREVDLFV